MQEYTEDCEGNNEFDVPLEGGQAEIGLQEYTGDSDSENFNELDAPAPAGLSDEL